MRRATGFAAGLAALLAVPSAAEATSVNPASERVSSGVTAVSSCGSLGGMSLSWNSTGGLINEVTLTAVPGTCIGATLSMTLAGTGGTALGTVTPTAINATTQSFTFSAGTPTASAVTTIAVSVVGP